MILRFSLVLVGVLVVAFVLLQDNKELLTAAVEYARNGQASSTERTFQPSESDNYASSDDSEPVIEANSRGSFYLTAEINGREINFLVDTGASQVALTREDADTIGLPVHQLDYSGHVRTANGVARISYITIDDITIGGNVINDVQGHVVDAPLFTSLLGMSFLRKLAGYEVKGDRLYLRW